MVELVLDMQYIDILVLINFFACAVSLSFGVLSVYRLFKVLEEKHPSYYKSIGKPIVLAPTDISWDSYIQLLKGGFFGYAMVFRGIPKGFPEDSNARKLAKFIRFALTTLLALLIPLVILGYALYKSDL